MAKSNTTDGHVVAIKREDIIVGRLYAEYEILKELNNS
jgi:hypothetical protein